MSQPVVVLTGAAGGIGSAIARKLLDDGHGIVAIDRERGEALAGVQWILADLAALGSDEQARRQLSDAIEAARSRLGTGPVSALVNNAAWQSTGPALEQDIETFNRSLAVNVTAPFVLARMLYPALAAARGCIVNIGSVHARQTKPGFCAYSTSKAALAGLTRALAVEWGGAVRVMGIEPAAIATPMLEAGFAANPEARARLAHSHPAGTIGDPAQVAAWVAHLVADSSPFANGMVVNLDGGVSFRLNDPA
jgi:NAD(P)-dependent dehydrogenase (short-subunit alcohol dehydrogenase family)